MAIKVMVVDDSAVVRQVMTELLAQVADIELIATASDPLFAIERMRKTWPDVLILDVEMPRMDGITFLKQIMTERPTPVIICSSLTQAGTDTCIQALAAGAVGILAKPQLGVKDFLVTGRTKLVASIREAALARVKRHRPLVNPTEAIAPKLNADVILPPPSTNAMAATTERIIAIGTSTGGTQALEVVLTALPVVCPGLVIVQHMPERYTSSFAARLNSICKIEVLEAKHQDRITSGRALIAPGGKHMLVKRSGAQYFVEVIDGPLVSRHRPSVDVLFRSVAKYAGRNALGVIMTGMGDDGARGIKEMHDQGARTIAQDEDSCVVFGMPKEAIKLNAIDSILALERIAQNLN